MNSSNENSTNTYSGRWTVVAMFGFAITMIALLFIYWELYTAPFRTLQYAVADEFPDSSPRVVGGQHKSHKTKHPKTLRIVIYVPTEDFDPEVAIDKSEARAFKLASLAFEHHDVDQYEELQLVLLQKVPESARKRWVMKKSVTEWKEIL